MDEVINNCFDEHNPVTSISLKKMAQDEVKAKILNVETVSLNMTNTENTPSVSLVLTADSTEALSKDDNVPSHVTLKSDSNKSLADSNKSLADSNKSLADSNKSLADSNESLADSNESLADSNESLTDSKITPPKTTSSLFKDFDKPMVEVEELLELINLEREDFEEILDMISSAKDKLEFFTSHVECLVNSLKENFKHLTVNNLRRNTYVKKIYRKKLEEFASGLSMKIKKSTKVLEVEYDILKEKIGKIAKTWEMISEFNENSEIINNGEKKWTSLIKIVNELLDEMYSMKSKQLIEIKEVSYIETDVEMLYDLYRRFSSIEGFNSMSTFNFIQQSC